jgi:hypothetical protein
MKAANQSPQTDSFPDDSIAKIFKTVKNPKVFNWI